MAHKKALGSAKKNRDSAGRGLGVKIFGGQKAKPGSIVIRQRGTKFKAGLNTGIGKDHTIYSKIAGTVRFDDKKITTFSSGKREVKVVNIIAK